MFCGIRLWKKWCVQHPCKYRTMCFHFSFLFSRLKQGPRTGKKNCIHTNKNSTPGDGNMVWWIEPELVCKSAIACFWSPWRSLSRRQLECWFFSICLFKSTLFSTPLPGCWPLWIISKASLPPGFRVSLVRGKHQQEIREQRESEVFIPLLPLNAVQELTYL